MEGNVLGEKRRGKILYYNTVKKAIIILFFIMLIISFFNIPKIKLVSAAENRNLDTKLFLQVYSNNIPSGTDFWKTLFDNKESYFTQDDGKNINHYFRSNLDKTKFSLNTNRVNVKYIYYYPIDQTYFVFPGSPLATSCKVGENKQPNCFVYRADFRTQNVFSGTNALNGYNKLENWVWLVVDKNGNTKGIFYASKEKNQESKSKIYNTSFNYSRNEEEAYVRFFVNSTAVAYNFKNPSEINSTPIPSSTPGTTEECDKLYKSLDEAIAYYDKIKNDIGTSGNEDKVKIAREKIETIIQELVNKKCNVDNSGSETERFKEAKKKAEDSIGQPVTIDRPPVIPAGNTIPCETQLSCSETEGTLGPYICSMICGIIDGINLAVDYALKLLGGETNSVNNSASSISNISNKGSNEGENASTSTPAIYEGNLENLPTANSSGEPIEEVPLSPP